MNYKNLLQKYITHVSLEEGDDFIGAIQYNRDKDVWESFKSEIPFTIEELSLLVELSELGMEEYN